LTRTNQNTNQSDETLLQLFRQSKDNKWLGILLQRYTLLLLGVAMKYLKDKTKAEDAVQQIFMKAFTHLPKEEINNFKGWLYILMRNHCLQQIKSERYYVEIDVVQIAEENAEKTLIDSLEYEVIHSAMETLVSEQRECIALFYLKKMSYQQITELTGYSYMQVKSYIQNGKRNLKQYLLAKENLND
jgi:RNA polymerase sigma factor (sigma-70 family)